jgi:UDP-N-acetylglucosamine acyltransferase
MIHPTAVVHPDACVDASSTVGPYTVIDEGVVIGADCVIGPHCHFTGRTRVGRANRFHAGCVVGDAPQDLKYKEESTELLIGDANVFREHVTVHRSNTMDEQTVIGSHNFLMACSHVGHNSVVGNHVILVNGALLAGHVTVQDRVFISGNCSIHQFVRIGTLALMQGNSAISKDLPPFTIVRDINTLCGLNSVGLRRAGVTSEERLELKQLYRLLFRSGLSQKEALARAGQRPASSLAARLLQFVADSKRGLCADPGRQPSSSESSRQGPT